MTTTIRILYVDDETSLLDIGKMFLEKGGALTVDTVTSAIDALEQLKTKRYDAIISDYQMPEMDGITFLKQLKGSGNTTPFIIFTGRGREDIVIEALNCGADFYIQKGGDPKSQFAELSHKIKMAVSRHKTEKLAKDTERRLYDIINFLPDATFAIDTDGIVIAWNKAIEEMTGIPACEMLGRGNFEYAIPFYGERRPILINLVSIPDEELTQGKYAIIKKEGGIVIAETTLPRPLGKYSVLLGKASLLYNDEGQVIGAIESIRDITEQKRAEEELQKARDKYVYLLEHMDAVYYQSDTEGRLILASKSWAKYLGYDDLSECLNKNIADTFYANPGDRKKFLEEVYRNGSVSDYEVTLKKKDGTHLLVATSSYLYFDESGTVLGIEGTWCDITGWKVAEKTQRESEERNRSILNASPDGIAITDLMGRILMVSPVTITMFGIEREDELLGHPITDFIVPQDRDRATANIAFMHKGVFSGPGGYRALHDDGSTFDIEVNGEFIKDASGKPSSMIFVIRDITERIKADEFIRLLARISDEAPASITVHDFEGNFLYANEKTFQIHGYTREEFLKKNLHEIDVPESEQLIVKRMQLVQDTGAADFDVQHFRKDGSLLPLHLNVKTVEWDRKKVLLSIATDLTERKNAEVLLKESELKYRSLIESSSDAIFCVDEKGEYKFTNIVFASTFGKTPDYFIGKTFWDIYPKEHADHRQSANLRVFETGVTQTLEVEVPLPDTTLYFIAKANPIKDETGKVMLNLTHATDITDRKRAETAIQQANQKLLLLSSITRHDINNQLTVLMGYQELVAIKQVDHDLIDYCQKAITAAQRIFAMIQFTKEYETLGISAPAWYDTSTLIETAAQQASLEKVIVKNDIPASLEVFADPLIIKVCYNLIENAVHYGKKLTTIRFSVLKRNDQHLIICEDDGVGVLAEEKEMIFERGFGKKTGLGLALSREILSITGITIKENGEPGKGARFELTVPKVMWRIGAKKEK